ncbi:hypothetical protein [Oribacterium sp. NK2B42]|uniref:hypothetical protein n=1 Tax=Oribacterium sp. NK2B42 TaxID=689781 RepID=UPI00040D9938|nr:hypothetical protein [Oribacterium sp. NK2B42]
MGLLEAFFNFIGDSISNYTAKINKIKTYYSKYSTDELFIMAKELNDKRKKGQWIDNDEFMVICSIIKERRK